MLFTVNLKCIKKNIYEMMQKKVSLTKNSHVNSTKSIFQWGCEAKICILLLLLNYNFKLKGNCGPSICFKFRLAVILKSYNWISLMFFKIGNALIISFLRGHSTTTWTEFCHFWPPLRGQFYTLSVDKNRYFLTPSPLILST